MFGDIMAQMFALTEKFEADFKHWVLIQTIRPADGGQWVLAVEDGARSPAVVHLVFRKSATVAPKPEGE